MKTFLMKTRKFCVIRFCRHMMMQVPIFHNKKYFSLRFLVTTYYIYVMNLTLACSLKYAASILAEDNFRSDKKIVKSVDNNAQRPGINSFSLSQQLLRTLKSGRRVGKEQILICKRTLVVRQESSLD